MNQGTEWGLLMKKNRSQKSRASVPLSKSVLPFAKKIKDKQTINTKIFILTENIQWKFAVYYK
jgi:hypothetical protein